MKLSLRWQRGFTLIELGLVLAIATIGLTASVRWAQRQGEQSRAVLRGQMLEAMGEALDVYTLRNLTALTADKPQIPISNGTSVANPLAPTASELAQLGFLRMAVNTQNPQLGYRTQLTPLGCGTDNQNCRMETLVWDIQPLLNKQGNYDAELLADAAGVMGVMAAWSSKDRPDQLVGIDPDSTTGLQTFHTNPMGAIAGILARIHAVRNSMVVNKVQCTCGDIKASLARASHGDWYLLKKGQPIGKNTCGLPVVAPDLDDRYLVQSSNQTLGQPFGSGQLTANNLPSFTLTGNTVPKPGEKEDGPHMHLHHHQYSINGTTWWCGQGEPIWGRLCGTWAEAKDWTLVRWMGDAWENHTYSYYRTFNTDWPISECAANAIDSAPCTGAHKHYVSLTNDRANPDVIQPKSFAVNYFVCANDNN